MVKIKKVNLENWKNEIDLDQDINSKKFLCVGLHQIFVAKLQFIREDVWAEHCDPGLEPNCPTGCVYVENGKSFFPIHELQELYRIKRAANRTKDGGNLDEPDGN